MSKIRRLYYFDKKNAQEMVAFLNNSGDFANRIMFNPLLPLHHLIPLRFKTLPESYIMKDGKNIKGIITVAPTKNPLKQMEIQKLLFEENCYEDAGELVQFAVSKYKAKGTASIIVRIDDYLPELIKLFISRCGFSQISYEKLWYIKNPDSDNFDKNSFREFRNSDSAAVANLYNDSLLPHFRPLLSKDFKEFKERFFKGLSYYSEYKYVIKDKSSKNIAGYISIKTSDNENYLVDFLLDSWTNIETDEIIAFANDKISKRKKNFNLFVKTKKYTQNGAKYEEEFLGKNYTCVQNQVVLTNSSARVIKEAEHTGKFTVLGQFYGMNGANVNLS